MIRKWIINDDEALKKARAAQKAFFKELDANIEMVRANLNLVAKNVNCPEDFELVKCLPKEWGIYESLHYSDNALPLQCFVLRYTTSVRAGRMSSYGEDFYLAGLLSLKKTYPHTIIYPETLAEKISEIFVKAEVDFQNNKKFSNRFYTLTKEEGSLKALLYDKGLDALSKYKTLEVELKDNHCFFRQSRKPINKKEATSFCELVKAVHLAFD